jgi:acyl carrier protein
MLRQLNASSKPELLSSNTHPSKFEDTEVREIIAALALTYDAPDENSQDRSKRRKVSQVDSSPMAVLMNSLGATLGLKGVDDDFPNLEQQFLLVTFLPLFCKFLLS